MMKQTLLLVEGDREQHMKKMVHKQMKIMMIINVSGSEVDAECNKWRLMVITIMKWMVMMATSIK